jgi:hypothetical protein
MVHGDAREGKWRGNWRMEWVASTLHITSVHVSSITTADAHTSAASTRLNWRPRRFEWTRLFRRKTKSGFCACAIAFQTQSTLIVVVQNNYLTIFWSLEYVEEHKNSPVNTSKTSTHIYSFVLTTSWGRRFIAERVFQLMYNKQFCYVQISVCINYYGNNVSRYDKCMLTGMQLTFEIIRKLVMPDKFKDFWENS